MREQKTNRAARYITQLLRHAPELEHLDMDLNGYVDVKQLCDRVHISKDDLKHIVADDNKTRFSYNDNETKIKANQGHTIEWLELELEESIPPETLYHGTSIKNYEKIHAAGGIDKMKRHHVHLSDNIDTAKTVGNRHGNPVIIHIDTVSMIDDGIKFYISKNKVWLTDFVAKKYFKELSY